MMTQVINIYISNITLNEEIALKVHFNDETSDVFLKHFKALSK